MAKTATAAADPVTEIGEKLTAFRAESIALDAREARASAALDALARDLPAAQANADLALAQADGHSGAADVVRKLELERTNAESVLRGVGIRRAQLAWESQVAEAALGRARAKAALPASGTAEISNEMGSEFFGYLGTFLRGIRTALAMLPRDDQRGATEAFDEAQLARWLTVKIAESGLDLDKARFVQRGVGVGPTDTLANLTAFLATLR